MAVAVVVAVVVAMVVAVVGESVGAAIVELCGVFASLLQSNRRQKPTHLGQISGSSSGIIAIIFTIVIIIISSNIKNISGGGSE